MSEKYSGGETEQNERGFKSFNRRKFLQAVGASGGLGILSAGAASASAKKTPNERTETAQERVNEILKTEKMQTILGKVGNPPIQRGRARTITTEADGEQITSTVLPTTLGDAVYGEGDGRSEAEFAFGASVLTNDSVHLAPGLAKKLPEPFTGLPLGSPGVHVIPDQGPPVQARQGTLQENESIAKGLGVSSDGIVSFAHSDIDDILIFDNENKEIYSAPSPSAEIPYREMTDKELSNLSISSGGIHLLVSDCYTYKTDCASYVGASAGCIGACTIAGVATFGAAFALCGICGAGSGFAAGTACGKYYKHCL